MNRAKGWLQLVALLVVAGRVVDAGAAETSEDLARLSQNPIANLISLPLQNNTNFDSPGTTNVLNIQPVVPISLGEDWNLITRTILPVVSLPANLFRGRVNGLGDMQMSGFLSPDEAKGGLVWGVGAIVQFPTNTSDALGNDRYGIGPSAVVLYTKPGSPWVLGVLVNNVFSVGGSSNPADQAYSNFLVQPFINFNFSHGFYLTSAPIITAAWKNGSGRRWVVPVGAGLGKVFHIGKLPVNAQLSGYYNAERTPSSGYWQLRTQVQLLFPK